MSLGDFAALAPALGNPLTLVGFALFLLFGIHRTLIKSGIIPPVRDVDAPDLVRQILAYGFWIAVLVIIAGLGYGLAKFLMAEVHKDISLLKTKSARLGLINSYADEANLFNVKMINKGDGDAFIYEFRLVHYSPKDVKDSVSVNCGAAPFTKLKFPFELSRKIEMENSTNIIPDYLADLPPVPPTFDTGQYRPKIVLLSEALKVGQLVPAGGIEWLKLELASTEKDQTVSRGCTTAVQRFANGIIFYNKGDYLVTPAFRFQLGF